MKKSKILTRIPLWFKVLFIVSFLGSIYMVSNKYYTEYQYENNSITIKAKVIDIEREEYESDGFPGKSSETITYITYEFSDEKDKTYKNKDIIIGGELYNISANKQSILIQYIKNNPTKNRIVKSKEFAILAR